jgi:porin
MRFSWIVLVALGDLPGEVGGQEPDHTSIMTDVAVSPTLDPGRPNGVSLRTPPEARTRKLFPTWQPIRRWFPKGRPKDELIRTGGPGDQVPTGPSNGPPGLRPGSTSGVPGYPGTAQPGPSNADTPPEGGDGGRDGSIPVSGNPAAVDIVTGTGRLGQLLGLSKDSGVRLGGLWIGDASGVLSGGRSPGKWGLNSLAILDLNLDGEKIAGWSGASFGTQFLQYSGQPTNNLAGAFPGFDSLDVTPPLVRQELYQLWYRQSFFNDKLIFRIGKTVPTYDFNNVVKPVPVSDPAAAIPAVSGLIYTPIFVNPTMLGVIPGYYNSATGITTTLAPTESLYLNYGFYDGNLALGRQTGLEGPHFNGYYFHIGEVGYAYRLGAQRKPGNFGVGVWGQTGKLRTSYGRTDEGANGVYLFGSQRLWFRNPGADNSGVSGFYQLGANNSDALLARQYAGGGLTAFGLVPRRPDDSFGVGLAWTWLTRGDMAGNLFFPDAPGPLQLSPSQLMIAGYYQMKLVDGVFFQTTLTDIPTPGQNAALHNALALTFRLVVLF